ncbi:hypothetical protein AJ87_33830 [Rhizobium yanglingense]|nr:hypothetical protein AJ87_33830 [Rhizobium yanglingense]
MNGDVFVEGHHVGQLSGFRFTPISGADGSDAKAIQTASQKALALEFEARAARLHAAGNSDLAISADGSSGGSAIRLRALRAASTSCVLASSCLPTNS